MPVRETGIDLVPTLVYDRVLEVPPGGETRIVIDPLEGIGTEGYIGPILDPDTKLGQAAELLPDWLREDFINNMVETGSRALFPSSRIIPAFGDLDADGDDDMVVGQEGAIFFYRNIGSAGYPIYIPGGWDDWVEVMNITGPGEGGFVSPTIFDFTHDGYGDLIWGDSTYYINFMNNPGIGNGSTEEREIYSLVNIFEIDPPTHRSPSVFSMNGDHMTLFYGAQDGSLNYYNLYFEFGDEFYGGYHINTIFGPFNVRVPIGPASSSAPRFWNLPQQGQNGDQGRRLISVGSGEGILYSYNLDRDLNGNFILTPNPGFFRNVAAAGPTTPVPANLNGDGFPDLVLTDGNGGADVYVQYGTDQSPYWAPDPTVPAFEIENYESSFDEVLRYLDQTSIESYLDTIIDPEDDRYRDEIGFCCAFTPPSQLADDRLADLLVENARYIYQRAPDLDYVRLVEYPGEDAYTTATYRVKAGHDYGWMEITRDAYYWGIVHPRVTEETVSYIAPDSGASADPENGGRFWREYIWENADDEYPPGPEYPEDHTGRYVYYPRNFTPPLLKEELEGVDHLWDLQPYSYPAGFDDTGEQFRYPDGYRDHAIEKVSQWVERTLPLNQQESLDNERPGQPVRIAASHNGNCGELQDLTIAAARCALIPARGTHLPGEDHVWSEFYLGGWHQWDNYWSDGGGVVGDDLNYWWGWGGRGGSGIWASNGAGQTFDVGERYRSPDITGSLRVAVVDANMNPVDGARVLVMSHWVTEQIDTGPYQGPLPTVPLPAIWGYTDHYGFCDLAVWRQNINIMVSSDLGTYVSGKFSVPETGGMYTMFVQLQGSKPYMQRYYPEPRVPDNGTRYLFSFEVEGSYQLQKDFYSGVLYRNEMNNGAVALRMYMGSYDLDSLLLDGDLIEGGAYTQEMRDGNDRILISLSDLSSFKENTRVRVKIWEVKEVEGSDAPDMVLANGNGLRDEGIDNEAEYPITGWIVSADKGYLDGIESITGQGPLWEFPFTIVRDHPLNFDREWSLRIGVQYVVGIPHMVNGFIVNVYNNTEGGGNDPITVFTWEIHLKNAKGPEWMDLMNNGDLSWGSKAYLEVYYRDPYGGFRGIGWIDGQEVWDVPSVETERRSHMISQLMDTAEYGGGNHRIAMTAIDPCGFLQPLTYSLRFLPIPPVLNVTSPHEGEDLYSNEVTVAGDVSDDVELVSLKVRIREEAWDITDTISEDGLYEAVIRFKGEPGIYPVEVNATDNVGLWTVKVVNLTLRSLPDEVDPTVLIGSPDDGSRFEKGEVITFRGTAYDLSGLSKLELSANGRSYDLLQNVEGRTFTFSLDTSGWSTGSKRITLTGSDPGLNTATDSIHVEIYEVVEEFKDREKPSIMVDEPTAGSSVRIGTTFQLSGHIYDDGPDITFELSIDRGERYEDLTSTLDRDWGFNVEIDTMEIISRSTLDPGPMKTVLENYPLIIRVEDGAGRQAFVEHQLAMYDDEAPTILTSTVDVDDVNDLVTIDVRAIDLTPIFTISAEVISPDGEVFRNVQLYHNELGADDGVTTGSLSISGNLVPGTYSGSVLVVDTWGNKAEMSVGFTIDAEEETGGPNLILIVVLSIAGLFLLAFVIYGLVRVFRRRAPKNY